jgi:RNA polymerase sigma factor (sigma-70 family)
MTLGPLVRRLRDLAEPAAGERPTDAELLARFADRRDPAAFELLVWRYAALVWGTCRRVLRRPDDAEDAFQATFLLLLRKAGSVRRRDALPGWLHRVALRAALRARAAVARRALREQSDPAAVAEAPSTAGDPAEATGELRELLDEEIDRLPPKLRAAVVLCYLDGCPTAEAARALGCPRGTVLSRLAAARERLRRRLIRRGVAPAVAAAAVAGGSASAMPPPMLVAETVGALLRVVGGGAAVGPGVVSLVNGVERTMNVLKLKLVLAVALTAGVIGGGTGWLLVRPGPDGLPVAAAGEPSGQPTPPKPTAANSAPDDAKAAKEWRDRELQIRRQLEERWMILEELEEKASKELINARLALADAEDRLRSLEPDRAAKLLDPESRVAADALRKSQAELWGVDESKGPNHPDRTRAQKQLRDAQQRYEELERKRQILEAEAADQRRRVRNEMFQAEEQLRRVERRIEFRRRMATTDLEAAAERLRQFNGTAAPADPSGRILRDVEQKLEALQRELAELRRDLKRP